VTSHDLHAGERLFTLDQQIAIYTTFLLRIEYATQQLTVAQG